MSGNRLEHLRGDLQIAIMEVKTSPGSILVIHPADDKMQFTPQYAEWLSETLRTLMPPGVRAMILSDSASSFEVVHPVTQDSWTPEQTRAYIAGWHDAMDALQNFTKEKGPRLAEAT